MANIVDVPGENKGKIFLYALSTCVWCKKTKEFLQDQGVQFSYIFVDLLAPEEKTQIREDIKKWNPDCSYPTVIINDKVCIVGFDTDRILLEIGR